MTKEEWKLFVDHVVEADEVYETFACEADDHFFEFVENTNFDSAINYSVFLSETDEMIGYVGFCVDEECSDNNYISYYTFKDHRYNGYAYEYVCESMQKFLRGEIIERDIEGICAWTIWGNTPSSELLEKLGFQGFGYRIYDDGTILHCYSYEPEKLEDTA
jgi:RimJ/RimL family protein N-acetyltransferase